jgi:hypothetical protein
MTTTMPETKPTITVATRERTISAVLESQTQAQATIKRLIERGIPAEDISVMGRNFESNTRVTGFITKKDVIVGGRNARRESSYLSNPSFCW